MVHRGVGSRALMKGNEMTWDEADQFVAGFDEEDAHRIFHALKRKFDWAGSPWSPDDIRACIKDNYADSITWDEDSIEEFVSECVNSRWWERALDEITTEHGWEVLGIMVEEALNEQVQS